MKGSFPYTNPYTQSGATPATQQQHRQPASQQRNLNSSSSSSSNRVNNRSFGDQISNANDGNLPKTVEEILSQLEQSISGIVETKTVVPLLKSLLLLQPQSSTWTVGQVVRFSEWFVSTLLSITTRWSRQISHSKNIQKGRHGLTNDCDSSLTSCFPSLMLTLSQLISIHWDDLQTYTAVMTVIEDDSRIESLDLNPVPSAKAGRRMRNRKTLMSVLEETVLLTRETDDTSMHSRDGNSEAILMALAATWLSLDRLNKHTSVTTGDSSRATSDSSSSWWLQHLVHHSDEDSVNSWMQIVTDTALSGLGLDPEEWHRQQKTELGISTQLCEYKTYCANVLVHLLNHQQTDWLYQNQFCYLEEDVNQQQLPSIALIKQLIQESARLNDVNMPVSTFTAWSLSCFQLVLLIQFHCSSMGSASLFWNEEIDTDFKRLLQTTDIVDHVIRATFWLKSMRHADESPRPKPRWTQPQYHDHITERLLLSIVQTLYHVSPMSVGNCVAYHVCTKYFLQTTWSDLFAWQSKLPQQLQLERLIFLHDICRQTTRESLESTVEGIIQRQQRNQDEEGGNSNSSRTELYQRLLYNLLQGVSKQQKQQHSKSFPSFLQATSLLKRLLQDGLHVVNHDEVSRYIWEAVLETEKCQPEQQSNGHRLVFAEKCLEMTVNFAQSAVLSSSLSDYFRPTMLCLLDLNYILLKVLSMSPSWSSSYQQSLISSLSGQSVETLIQIVTPKQELVRVDDNASLKDDATNDNSFDSSDSDESTPTVDNLSRNDRVHNNAEKTNALCFGGGIVEEERMSRGIDPQIRMAAASLLAFLGDNTSCHHQRFLIIDSKTNMNHRNNEDGRIVLLQGRMLDATNTFVADLQLSFTSINPNDRCYSSLDSTRRRLRLLTVLGSPDNEEYLAGLLHAGEHSQRKIVSDLQATIAQYKNSLREERIKEKRLSKEKEKLGQQLSAQSVRFQREKSELQRSMAQNAKQLVEVHATERAKAEKRAQGMSKNMAEAERLLAEAEKTAQLCRESEAQVKSSLEQTAAKLEQVSSREKELAQNMAKRESELRRVSDELESKSEKFKEMADKEKEMEERLKQQEEELVHMEKAEENMHSSLENLFGDMVSLARLYQVKEKEEKALREDGDVAVEKMRRKLELERQRNAELEEGQKRIQYDNEMLSKKYAKAREKLENEREERRKENERRKRAGPVSYINQLHTSTSFATSESQRKVLSRTTSTSSRRREGDGKENSQSVGSSSFRSSKTSRTKSSRR